MKKNYSLLTGIALLTAVSGSALAQSAPDATVTQVYLPQYAAIGSSLTLEGDVSNVGTAPIAAYTINYRVNNGPIVSRPGATVPVPVGGGDVFTFAQPWTPTAAGTYNFKFWTSATGDVNRANDTLRVTLQVASRIVPRKVVAEVFTSSTCPPCYAGNQVFEQIRGPRRNQMVVVKYQQNYPRNTAFPTGDPYYTTETVARHNFYGITGIPDTRLNGTGWAGNPQSLTAGTVNTLAQEIAVADVDVVYTLNTTTRTVTATARIKPYVPVAANELAAYMLVTERHTALNRATNGETEFYDVVKKMLPNQSGTTVPALARDQSWNLNQTYTFPAYSPSDPISRVENFDSLRVVVFIQNRTTNEVLQGSYARLNGVLGTQKAKSGPAFDVAPNPSTGNTSLFVKLARTEAVHVEVLDALGRRVSEQTTAVLSSGEQQLPLSLTGRAPGLYTVRLTTTEGVRTQQLVIE